MADPNVLFNGDWNSCCLALTRVRETTCLEVVQGPRRLCVSVFGFLPSRALFCTDVMVGCSPNSRFRQPLEIGAFRGFPADPRR